MHAEDRKLFIIRHPLRVDVQAINDLVHRGYEPVEVIDHP